MTRGEEVAENCGDHAGEVGLVPGNYVIDVQDKSQSRNYAKFVKY